MRPNAPSMLTRWGWGAAEALRHGEERLRLLTQQMPAIIWSTDTQLRITSSLAGALARLELKPDELVGRTLAAHRRAL